MVTALLAVIAGGGGADGGAALANGSRALQNHAQLPLTFVPNRGQVDKRVLYHAHGPRQAFHLTADEVVLSLSPGSSALRSRARAPVGDLGLTLALRFVGSDPDVTIAGRERARGHVTYLRGRRGERGGRRLPGYGAAVYRSLWRGVDMVLRGRDSRLKYEFRVRPGARVSDIRLAWAGADRVRLDDGALVLDTPLGELRDAAPVSWQHVDGRRVPVDSRYVLDPVTGRHGFSVGAGYDPRRELIIDPGVDYSTLVGGSSHELGNGVAVDSAGNAYVVGTTQSTDLPTSTGAIDRSFNGGVVDVFVTKLDATGSSAVYSTYLGGVPTPLRRGSGDPLEFGRAIAVDADGHAYITGQTTSSDFPTTSGALQPSLNATPDDATDAFVAKLNPAGTGLVYSTFLGGASRDDGMGITVDGSGNAYVTGETHSSDFPTTTGAFQTSRGTGGEGFVAKLNATGSALSYSTFLGGADNEQGRRVRVDASGRAHVAGATRSADFPTTVGAYDTSHNGAGFDAFVTRLSASGSQLEYSTFLGGSGMEFGDGLALDASGHAYVSGSTNSPEFPTTAGAWRTAPASSSDGYVTKLAPDGGSLVYSTFVGGGTAPAVALDIEGRAWITGATSLASFPTTADAFDGSHNGDTDAYAARLDVTGSSLDHATFLGGAGPEHGSDIVLHAAGGAYVVGTTYSFDFPTTQGAFDTTFGGDPTIFWGDAFVVKVGDGGGTVNPPVSRTTTQFSGTVRENQQIHSVTVGAAGPVDLELNWDDSRASVGLRARAPSGAVVFENTGAGRPKSGSFFATVAGIYQFEVIGQNDRRASYTLSVTHPVAQQSAAALTLLTVSPTSVSGGSSATGTVALTAAAPPGGAAVALASSNTAAASVPASVTVPAGQTSATFTIATTTVPANTTSTISAAYGGVTKTAALSINAATGPALSSLALSPTSVTGGQSSTGTATLTAPAPSGGAVVSLISSNTAVATVPASVSVPAGSTGATFTIATANVTVDSSSSISASHGGVTRSAILSVQTSGTTPPPGSTQDTVSITRAEYDSDKRVLRVEASSSGSGATLRAHVSSTDQLIGTLSGGRGEFSWPSNPVSITVRSSLGGSASRSVTVK